MGYMPVISNLSAPILDYISRGSEKVRFKAVKFASFSEMAEALRHDEIQAAFMIAPLAIVMRKQKEDVKVVYIGNRHESTLVVRSDLNISSFEDLAGSKVAVPIRFSGHNIALLQLMEKKHLDHEIQIVEMNPPDMASALSTGTLDAYFVGEPFAAATIQSGHARVLLRVEDIWPNFICNLLVVHQNFINRNHDLVQLLVHGAARAGIWADKHPSDAARIAADYWNQSKDFVEYALTTPPDRVVYNRFIPKGAELQRLADFMVRYQLLDDQDIKGLVEDRFAIAVDTENITDIYSILPI
jgi:NitT/TauT family transport system substrate-binding protein